MKEGGEKEGRRGEERRREGKEDGNHTKKTQGKKEREEEGVMSCESRHKLHCVVLEMTLFVCP